jgi:hypothetical protein
MAVAFWTAPEFAEFVPYLRTSWAHDTRQGKHARLELLPSTPWVLQAKALQFTGSCAKCGRRINPFRSRAAERQRGRGGQGVYLATSCRLNDNIGCSRGREAAIAYDAIERLIADYQREHAGSQPQQQEMFG